MREKPREKTWACQCGEATEGREETQRRLGAEDAQKVKAGKVKGPVEKLFKVIAKRFREIKRERWKQNSLGPSGSFFLSHKTLLGSPFLELVPISARNNVLLFSVLKRQTTTKTILG